MDGVDDLRAVDPLQIERCDAQVGAPELVRAITPWPVRAIVFKLALNADQRHPLMRHLDRVRAAELMGANRRRTLALAVDPEGVVPFSEVSHPVPLGG